MPVPAEKLMKAVGEVTDNYEAQLENYKKLYTITEQQLQGQIGLVAEQENVIAIQNRLIKTQSDMNDRYEVLLAERDKLIKELCCN